MQSCYHSQGNCYKYWTGFKSRTGLGRMRLSRWLPSMPPATSSHGPLTEQPTIELHVCVLQISCLTLGLSALSASYSGLKRHQWPSAVGSVMMQVDCTVSSLCSAEACLSNNECHVVTQDWSNPSPGSSTTQCSSFRDWTRVWRGNPSVGCCGPCQTVCCGWTASAGQGHCFSVSGRACQMHHWRYEYAHKECICAQLKGH